VAQVGEGALQVQRGGVVGHRGDAGGLGEVGTSLTF
jgi:hypothetical protein